MVLGQCRPEEEKKASDAGGATATFIAAWKEVAAVLVVQRRIKRFWHKKGERK